MITISKIWDRALVEPLTQPKLEFQDHDSKKSVNCPIYVSACKTSIYLCLTDDIEVTWHGGHDYTAKVPDWWKSVWDSAKRDWYLGNGSSSIDKTRYAADAPFASKRGGSFLHAGGLLLNFFTGLSIKTDPGKKVLVTRPTNQFSPVWTIQDGIYDSDFFAGDFSFNLQVMRTEPFLIRSGEPIASLFEIDAQVEQPFVMLDKQNALDEEKATAFYLGKATGCRYRQLVSDKTTHC